MADRNGDNLTMPISRCIMPAQKINRAKDLKPDTLDQLTENPGHVRFKAMLNDLVRTRQGHRATPMQPCQAKDTDCRERDAFVAALQSCCMSRTRLYSFKSVPTVRAQLQAEFIHLHYAKEGEDFFPSKMILLLSPETSSLTAATNALYLAQLATSNRDVRLLRNAALSYRGACQLVGRDLSRPGACYEDHLFGTMHVLGLCEAFKGLSADDPGRSQHALAQMFHARGPKSFNDVYMMIQLQQHHYRDLVEGLLNRKRPLIGHGDWLNVDKKCHLQLTALTSLALRVPGALEDATKLLTRESRDDLKAIMEMLTTLKALETRLHDWITAWYARIEVLPYWKEPAMILPWLPENERFASALQFRTPLVAKAHALYWMPLLALRQMIKAIADLNPFPLLAATRDLQERSLFDDIYECADNLCMTAMYLTNPSNGTDGCMEALGPILLAQGWFQKAGDSRKLDWCDQMLEHIENRGIRTASGLPSIQP